MGITSIEVRTINDNQRRVTMPDGEYQIDWTVTEGTSSHIGQWKATPVDSESDAMGKKRATWYSRPFEYPEMPIEEQVSMDRETGLGQILASMEWAATTPTRPPAFNA